jgi:hypothetical protein
LPDNPIYDNLDDENLQGDGMYLPSASLFLAVVEAVRKASFSNFLRTCSDSFP